MLHLSVNTVPGRNPAMERKFDRKEVSGVYGVIARDKHIISGVVDNVSPGGFKISHLPLAFENDKHCYSIVISKDSSHYKIMATPCWETRGSGEHDLEVGFKIIDAPWEWAELTYN